MSRHEGPGTRDHLRGGDGRDRARGSSQNRNRGPRGALPPNAPLPKDAPTKSSEGRSGLVSLKQSTAVPSHLDVRPAAASQAGQRSGQQPSGPARPAWGGVKPGAAIQIAAAPQPEKHEFPGLRDPSAGPMPPPAPAEQPAERTPLPNGGAASESDRAPNADELPSRQSQDLNLRHGNKGPVDSYQSGSPRRQMSRGQGQDRRGRGGGMARREQGGGFMGNRVNNETSWLRSEPLHTEAKRRDQGRNRRRGGGDYPQGGSHQQHEQRGAAVPQSPQQNQQRQNQRQGFQQRQQQGGPPRPAQESQSESQDSTSSSQHSSQPPQSGPTQAPQERKGIPQGSSQHIKTATSAPQEQTSPSPEGNKPSEVTDAVPRQLPAAPPVSAWSKPSPKVMQALEQPVQSGPGPQQSGRRAAKVTTTPRPPALKQDRMQQASHRRPAELTAELPAHPQAPCSDQSRDASQPLEGETQTTAKAALADKTAEGSSKIHGSQSELEKPASTLQATDTALEAQPPLPANDPSDLLATPQTQAELGEGRGSLWQSESGAGGLTLPNKLHGDVDGRQLQHGQAGLPMKDGHSLAHPGQVSPLLPPTRQAPQSEDPRPLPPSSHQHGQPVWGGVHMPQSVAGQPMLQFGQMSGPMGPPPVANPVGRTFQAPPQAVPSPDPKHQEAAMRADHDLYGRLPAAPSQAQMPSHQPGNQLPPTFYRNQHPLPAIDVSQGNFSPLPHLASSLEPGFLLMPKANPPLPFQPFEFQQQTFLAAAWPGWQPHQGPQQRSVPEAGRPSAPHPHLSHLSDSPYLPQPVQHWQQQPGSAHLQDPPQRPVQGQPMRPVQHATAAPQPRPGAWGRPAGPPATHPVLGQPVHPALGQPVASGPPPAERASSTHSTQSGYSSQDGSAPRQGQPPRAEARSIDAANVQAAAKPQLPSSQVETPQAHSPQPSVENTGSTAVAVEARQEFAPTKQQHIVVPAESRTEAMAEPATPDPPAEPSRKSPEAASNAPDVASISSRDQDVKGAEEPQEQVAANTKPTSAAPAGAWGGPKKSFAQILASDAGGRASLGSRKPPARTPSQEPPRRPAAQSDRHGPPSGSQRPSLQNSKHAHRPVPAMWAQGTTPQPTQRVSALEAAADQSVINGNLGRPSSEAAPAVGNAPWPETEEDFERAIAAKDDSHPNRSKDADQHTESTPKQDANANAGIEDEHTAESAEVKEVPAVPSIGSGTPSDPTITTTNFPALSSSVGQPLEELEFPLRQLPEEVETVLRGLVADYAQLVLASHLRLQPRGLVNTGNLCFMNSILQALMASSPFCKFLQMLQTVQPAMGQKELPTLHAFSKLAAAFSVADPAEASPAVVDLSRASDSSTSSPKKGASDMANGTVSGTSKLNSQTLSFLGGKALLPEVMFPTVNRFNPRNVPVNPALAQPVSLAERLKGKRMAQREQEDAQEFLGFLLDSAHEELVRLKAAYADRLQLQVATSAPPEEDGGVWVKQKKGNKKAATQETGGKGSGTVVQDLCGGQYVSQVKAAGAPQSDTTQPFTLLTLDILPDSVKTISEAITRFTEINTIEDYKLRKGGPKVQATQRVLFLTLPRLLIVHLSRFMYDTSTGNNKVHKRVHFDARLAMKPSWLAAECSQRRSPPEYDLIATVTHLGTNSTSGHYVANVKQPNGKWLCFDDANVTMTPLNKVLDEAAYLLIYQLAA